MVEYKTQQKLDSIFAALSDPTRRDILKRVAKKALSVNEVALPYKVSLAAVSKHLNVLERARLIEKQRRGRQHFIHLTSSALKSASRYLKAYERVWNDRFDRLDSLLTEKIFNSIKRKGKRHGRK